MKSFLLRHEKGPLSSNGQALYDEETYINQQAPSITDRYFLYCFTYAETLWHKGYQYRWRYNPERWWSFALITEGNSSFVCDKVRYKCEPYGILIANPAKKKFQNVGSSGFLRRRVIGIKGPLVEYICKNSNLANIDYIQPDDPSRIINIYDKIKKIIIEDKEYCQQELSNELYAFLNELCRLTTPHKYPASLHHALSIINSNPYKEHSLESLCEECNISASVLFRHFKKYLGISPINYIIDLRLTQVKLLLRISDISLKEISKNCGYKNQAFMSHAFKKKFGMSPSQFRHKN